MKEVFRKIVGKRPYEFQLRCIDVLTKGNPLILTAPTGSGKSEAIVVPFLIENSKRMPSQMIYALPTRVLIDNLSKRINKYAQKKKLTTAFHHGIRKESEFFNEDIILTTIDQTVGAYICTPLSMPIKRGNIFAGAVASAFLVFDEVHTFDPNRGLQAALILIEHSSRLGLPFAISSATLPDVLIDKIKELSEKKTKRKTRIVSVENEKEIKSRKRRRINLHTRALIKNKTISVENILEIYNASKSKKLIVVCNTVDKAQRLYQALKKVDKIDARVILIHARFLDENRKKKEELLQRLFSRNKKEKAILISTQVIEVGIDISSDVMLSELAPIDSLIQRAGRCARWGGKGDFYVFDIENYGPYKSNKLIMDRTKSELKKLDKEILSWELERKLVNSILSSHYKEFLKGTKMAKILAKLAKVSLEGSRREAEETVRDIYTCNVSVHKNPKKLCNEANDVFKLQKININTWVFRSKIKKVLEKNVNVWLIEESNILDDYSIKFVARPIERPEEVLPFKFYVISPDGAYYDADVGLIIGLRGKNNFALLDKTIEKEQKEFVKKYEPWIVHAKKILQIADRCFISKYNFVIQKFAKALNLNKKELIEKIRIAIALHDLGKLNYKWQNKIGGTAEVPLAHNQIEKSPRIPHATVSANALLKLWPLGKKSKWSKVIWALLLAIAHHHSPRARKFESYKFIPSWKKIVGKLKSLVPIDVKKINPEDKGGSLLFGMPSIDCKEDIIPYRLYSFVSKILRLSDQIASANQKCNTM